VIRVIAIAIGLVVAAGCGHGAGGPGVLRFHNRAPVTLVNDRAPIPEPETEDKGLVEYYVREDFIEPARRAMTVTATVRAQNVNSLGHVPDSAWFTNRSPTPEEIRRGPGLGGPDPSKPWRVVGVKIGGAAIGITIIDGRGDKYVLKFDERGHPETETSADVVVQRLAWAFGYNVPDNEVVDFDRADLVLDPKATIKTRGGDEKPMTEADLDKYLGMVEHDGTRFRGLASRFIDGTILGGVEPTGVRDGDPNDRVAHELRRDLRGQRVLWAWVNHPDIKSQNMLATYTAGRYVTWYTLDFGESLGVASRAAGDVHLGYRKMFTLRGLARSLVTFGLEVRPWERQVKLPPYRGLGAFDAGTFELAAWKTAHNWRPTDAADRFDELWAAAILMRLTPAHVEAAVGAGRYTDARTADYLVRTLLARQRTIGREAFSRVIPLDGFAVRLRGDGAGAGIELCFDDLWLRYRYGEPGATRYRATAYGYDGRALGGRGAPVTGRRGGRGCAGVVPHGETDDGYTIVRIEVARPGDGDPPPVFVHVARGPRGYRVIGVDRR
jgi:hypothetical protein